MKERRRHVDEAKESPSPSAPLLPRRKPTGGSPPPRTSLEIKLHERYIFFLFFFNTGGIFGFVFYVLYSTLLHLPPLRFSYVGGCWDRTQDSSDFCIGSQTL
jgi:hypothetical protein